MATNGENEYALRRIEKYVVGEHGADRIDFTNGRESFWNPTNFTAAKRVLKHGADVLCMYGRSGSLASLAQVLKYNPKTGELSLGVVTQHQSASESWRPPSKGERVLDERTTLPGSKIEVIIET